MEPFQLDVCALLYLLFLLFLRLLWLLAEGAPKLKPQTEFNRFLGRRPEIAMRVHSRPRNVWLS